MGNQLQKEVNMKAVIRLDLPEQNEGNKCKDCNHYIAEDESCDRIGGIVSENSYCSDWEKKDE